MDFQRLFLFLIFVFSLGLVWDGWQRHQHPEHYVQQSAAASEAASTSREASPAPASATSIPSAVAPVVPAQGVISQQTPPQTPGKIIRVKTDVLEAEISTIGGDISRLSLLKHPDAQDKNKPLVLFDRGAGTHNYVAQSGLLGTGLPNHYAAFVPEQDHYELGGDTDRVQVRLKAEDVSPPSPARAVASAKVPSPLL